MNEASFTKYFKEKLTQRGFYVKKLADRSSRGIPDSIYCKNHKAFMGEVKFFNVTSPPETFKRWSALKPNGKMVQWTTMLQFDEHFLARYIFAYQIEQLNEILLCKMIPSRLLSSYQLGLPIALPKLQNIDIFIDDLERFLFLSEKS